MDHSIRVATAADADHIAEIYNHYIAKTVVTFEEEPVAGDEMRRRMDEVFGASLPWLVAESGGRVIGYAYATKWKARSAYRFSVETTVYLADGLGKLGLGSRLYQELFSLLKEKGIHAVIGGIALPNDASVALHEKFGMRKVAHFEQVGFKFGKWVDVGYWERLL
jgi:L-amino acid N-acyltransferase YncA